MRFPKTILAAFLAILPPLASILVRNHLYAPPAHALLYPDPDFGYLFNSLLLLDGQTPWHIDHPGTPIQLIGALLMKLQFAFAGTAPTLALDFFRNPLAYQQLVLRVLFTLFLFCQWCSGFWLMRSGVPRILSLAVASLPLTSFDLIDYFDHVSPECMMTGISLLLVPLCLPSRRQPLAVGVLLGLLCSLKATAFPLLLLLFLLPEKRARWQGLASAALFYLFVTAPIWSEYPRMLSWYVSLGSNAGAYGQGPSALPSHPQLLSRLAWLLSGGQWFGLAPALLLFPLLLLVPTKSFARWPLAAAALIHFALVIKHPATRYILPFLPMAGLAILRVVSAPRLAQAALAAALLAPAPFLIHLPLDGMANWRRQESEAITELVQTLDRDYGGCQVTIVNEIGHPAFALFAGNFATGFQGYGEALDKELWRYNFLFVQVRRFGSLATPADWQAFLQRGGCHVLVGRPALTPTVIESLLGQKPEELAKIGTAANYGIYRIPDPVSAKIPEKPSFVPATTPYSLEKLSR